MPHFTRPLTDNDKRGWKPQKKLKEWYTGVLKLINISVAENQNGSVKIVSDYLLKEAEAKDKEKEGFARVKICYTINGVGVIKVDYSLDPDDSLPNIPKVGMQCGIARQYENILWYGRGPLENYIDRRYGFDAGIYSMNIFDFMEPYVKPQENGNRTDIRWMYLSDKNNSGLLIVADSLLSMSAWPYTENNYVKAKHIIDLKDAGFLTLNIDFIQMGVGGNDSWSEVAAPLEQYQIKAKPYHYVYFLLPFNGKYEEISNYVKKVKF